jgi:sn-glycerol 3-phosphate transport system ATP-binding protein
MTVRQNMAYPLRIARMPKGDRERRVADAAALLDLSDDLDRRPAQLSGGQRQRVAMGRAIVREPAVFLFDEPMSNLDAKLRVQMRIEIRRLHKRLSVTSVFVTHDQVEAMTLADTLVVMNAGKVEQVGTPSAVYRHPASSFVAGFLGAPAMNLVSAAVTSSGQIAFGTSPRFAIAAPGPLPAAGTRLILGIRPEDVVITGDPANGFPVQIDLVEELGGSQVAYCQVADKAFSIVLPRGFSNVGGAEIFLQFPPQFLHFFDAQTGKRFAASSSQDLS